VAQTRLHPCRAERAQSTQALSTAHSRRIRARPSRSSTGRPAMRRDARWSFTPQAVARLSARASSVTNDVARMPGPTSDENEAGDRDAPCRVARANKRTVSWGRHHGRVDRCPPPRVRAELVFPRPAQPRARLPPLVRGHASHHARATAEIVIVNFRASRSPEPLADAPVRRAGKAHVAHAPAGVVESPVPRQSGSDVGAPACQQVSPGRQRPVRGLTTGKSGKLSKTTFFRGSARAPSHGDGCVGHVPHVRPGG
jgi:hypothetical protein